ncbi:hypothetical protein [Nostoc sp.]|uniref:hypothetical protein n=1 Tax=Nostoc sp. TaxID=1180 RepID=UPI002FF89113
MKVISNDLLVFLYNHTIYNFTAIAPIFLDNNSIRPTTIELMVNYSLAFIIIDLRKFMLVFKLLYIENINFKE